MLGESRKAQMNESLKLIEESDGYLVMSASPTEISLPSAAVARVDPRLRHGLSIKTIAPLTVRATGDDTIDGKTSIELPAYGVAVFLPLFNEDGIIYWSVRP